MRFKQAKFIFKETDMQGAQGSDVVFEIGAGELEVSVDRCLFESEYNFKISGNSFNTDNTGKFNDVLKKWCE